MKNSLTRFPKIIDIPGWGSCSLAVKFTDYGWQVGYMDKSGAFAWLAQDRDADIAVKNLEKYLNMKEIPVTPEVVEAPAPVRKDKWEVILRWLFLIGVGIILWMKL